MDIHLVRVLQYVDMVNLRWKPAQKKRRPAFFSVHVDSYDMTQWTGKNMVEAW